LKKRHITREELELWHKVAKTTEPLTASAPVEKPTLLESLQVPKSKTPVAVPYFNIGQAAKPPARKDDSLPGLPDSLAQQPINMDKKTHARLKRGKVQPEARIDLHGMTVAQAQPALSRFILNAQVQNKRLVLVITGKGKNADDGGPVPTRHGVLRHAVPQWLSTAPLAQLVLQVTAAHARHGGAGAYYVYLRRNR